MVKRNHRLEYVSRPASWRWWSRSPTPSQEFSGARPRHRNPRRVTCRHNTKHAADRLPTCTRIYRVMCMHQSWINPNSKVEDQTPWSEFFTSSVYRSSANQKTSSLFMLSFLRDALVITIRMFRFRTTMVMLSFWRECKLGFQKVCFRRKRTRRMKMTLRFIQPGIHGSVGVTTHPCRSPRTAA